MNSNYPKLGALRRPVLPFCGALAAFLAASAVAAPPRVTTAIGRNPSFETGRGDTPLGNSFLPSFPNWQLFDVDLPLGDYNPLESRIQNLSEVSFFVPGVPPRDEFVRLNAGAPVAYFPFDWWFGLGGSYASENDPANVTTEPAAYVNDVVPRTGLRMLRFRNTGGKYKTASDRYQDIDVAAFATGIAKGTATVTASGYFNRVPEDAAARIVMDFSFYDATKTLIPVIPAPPVTDALIDGNPATWENQTVQNAIPANTRYIRFHMAAEGQNQLTYGGDGAYIGTYADDVTISLTYDQADVAVTVNTDFESPDVADGTGSGATPPSWTVPGGVGTSQVLDPSTSQFPTVPSGSQVGTLTSVAGGGGSPTHGFLSQDTPFTITPGASGAIYVFEVAVGRFAGGTPAFPSGGYEVGIYAVDNTASYPHVVASRSSEFVNASQLVTPAAGTFENVVVQYVAHPGDTRTGQTLGIYVRSIGAGTMAVDRAQFYRMALQSPIVDMTSQLTNTSFETNAATDGATAAIGTWSISNATHVRVSNPTNNSIPTAGAQIGVIKNQSQYMGQALAPDTLLQPNTIYSLRVDVGRSAASSPGGRPADLVLFYNGTAAAPTAELARFAVRTSTDQLVPNLPVGVDLLKQAGLTFVTGPSVPAGTRLIVRLEKNDNGPGDTELDNVRLTRTGAVTPAPNLRVRAPLTSIGEGVTPKPVEEGGVPGTEIPTNDDGAIIRR